MLGTGFNSTNTLAIRNLVRKIWLHYVQIPLITSGIYQTLYKNEKISYFHKTYFDNINLWVVINYLIKKKYYLLLQSLGKRRILSSLKMYTYSYTLSKYSYVLCKRCNCRNILTEWNISGWNWENNLKENLQPTLCHYDDVPLNLVENQGKRSQPKDFFFRKLIFVNCF